MHLIAAVGHLFAATSTKKSSSSGYILIVYVAIIFAFYYFFIRPRNRKAREARSVGRQFEVGDRVQTIGGMVGTVVTKGDDVVSVRGDSGAVIDFVPQAIARRIDPVVPESADDDSATEHHDDGPDAPGSDH